MSQENVEIVRGAYEEFNSGNIPGVLERLDPEVEWTEPGGGKAPSGTFRGPESVGQDVFSAVPENFDEFSAEPAEFRDEDDKVIVTGRFKGTAKSGAELDAAFEHVFELADGKIVRFNNDVEEEAWAQAWS
jgi:ketosteroid isomerase-like protein